MLAGVALTYSLLAAFVLSCVGRNRRAKRANAPMLTLVSWAMMSASFTGAALLLALAVTLKLSS
jgi:ABC-type Na+ efflux pump permease subunit